MSGNPDTMASGYPDTRRTQTGDPVGATHPGVAAVRRRSATSRTILGWPLRTRHCLAPCVGCEPAPDAQAALGTPGGTFTVSLDLALAAHMAPPFMRRLPGHPGGLSDGSPRRPSNPGSSHGGVQPVLRLEHGATGCDHGLQRGIWRHDMTLSDGRCSRPRGHHATGAHTGLARPGDMGCPAEEMPGLGSRARSCRAPAWVSTGGAAHPAAARQSAPAHTHGRPLAAPAHDEGPRSKGGF